jgi:hypothetical protein
MRALITLVLLAVPVFSFAPRTCASPLSRVVRHQSPFTCRTSPHTCVSPLSRVVRHQSPFTCRISRCVRMTAAEKPQDEPEATLSEVRSETVSTSNSPLGKVKKFFSGDGENRKKISQLGLYALLSYGFVSNASYAICLW